MTKKDFPQEEGIRRRYLREFERLKVKHSLTNNEFAQKLGFKNGFVFSSFIAGTRKISLEYIAPTLEAFPDFDILYVMASREMPEIQVTNLQGKHGKGKAGRKPKHRPAVRTPLKKSLPLPAMRFCL